MGKRQLEGIGYFNPAANRLLQSRFGVVARNGIGTFTRDGENLTNLRVSLQARLNQLAASSSKHVESSVSEELDDEMAGSDNGEADADLQVLKFSLTLCNESIEEFGAQDNRLLREKDQESISGWFFYLVRKLLREQFGVSTPRGSNALTGEGETLADLRKALLVRLKSSNVGLSKPKLDSSSRQTLLRRALRWCETSIAENGGDSDSFLSQNQYRGGGNVAPFLKDNFGVETAKGGPRKGTRTQEGTTLSDIRRDLLAQLEAQQEGITRKVRKDVQEARPELSQLKGALRWCEASIKANAEESDLLLSQSIWPESAKFSRLLQEQFGVETANGGPRQGTRTREGTTLKDLQKALSSQISGANVPTIYRKPRTVKAQEAQNELSQLDGALQWCEASIKANGGQSDAFLSQSQWAGSSRYAAILKDRFGVRTVPYGLLRGTFAEKTLEDLKNAIVAERNELRRKVDSSQHRSRVLKRDSDSTSTHSSGNEIGLRVAHAACEIAVSAKGRGTCSFLGHQKMESMGFNFSGWGHARTLLVKEYGMVAKKGISSYFTDVTVGEVMDELQARIEGMNSGKRLKMSEDNDDDDDDVDDGEELSMHLESESFSEASDSDERQKLLAMGFESDAIRKAMAAYDAPEDVLDYLVNMAYDDDNDDDNDDEPIRAKKRAKSPESESESSY